MNGTNGINGTDGEDGTSFTADWNLYDQFSSQSDFLTKMNALQAASTTSGGGSGSTSGTYDMVGPHWWIGWTDQTTVNNAHWTSKLRPANTFSHDIDSGYLYEQNLRPFVHDLISKIKGATDGTNTGLLYNGDSAYPYKVWNNTTSNVGYLDISNFSKIMIRMRVYPTQLDMFILVWVNNTNAWGYWQQSIHKSSNWTGDMVHKSSPITRTTVPVPTHLISNYTQYLN